MKKVNIILVFIISFIIIVKVPVYSSNIKMLKTETETIDEDAILEQMLNKNVIAIDEWVETYFGPIVSSVVSKEYDSIVDYRYYLYELRTPFLRNYYILVDAVTHKPIDYVSSSDVEFDKIYNERIRKQLGIEDDNVKLKLQYGDINFKNIKSLNENYDEIFENCPYILEEIDISKVDEKDKCEIFNDFRHKYYNKINKDNENSFTIIFDNDYNDRFYIKDFVKIGKKDCRLKKLNLWKNKSIEVVCREEQVDDIIKNIENIYELIENNIPTKNKKIYIGYNDKVTNKILKTLENKFYVGSVLRLDLSNIINNNYVIDALYYDATYDDDDHALTTNFKNPKYLRHNIQLSEKKYKLINYTEIHHSEYIGDMHIKNLYDIKWTGEETTIYDNTKKEYSKKEFYGFKLIGQPDDDIINKNLKLKFEEVVKEFIENNQITSRRPIDFNVFLQSNNYIIIQSEILENFLVLDLKNYKFVSNKIIGKDEDYILLEIEGKKFLMSNNKYKNKFIDYTTMKQNANAIDIKFYKKGYEEKDEILKLYNYKIDIKNKKMQYVSEILMMRK